MAMLAGLPNSALEGTIGTLTEEVRKLSLRFGLCVRQEQSHRSRFGWSASRQARWSVARHGTRLPCAQSTQGGAQTRGRKPMVDTDVHIKFDAPAVLRKWPSLNNEGSAMPYLVAGGTLDECIRQFTLKPMSELQLYEILTAPQGEEITAVLSAQQILGLTRLRDFL